MTANEEGAMQESERHEAGERADAARSKPTKRAKVMRGIVAPVFGLLAVTFFALGLLNATLWKPNASVTATGYLTSRYAVTDPGMLSLLDGTVNLQVGLDKATADGAGRSAGSDEGSKVSQEQPGKVCVAIGLAKDVSGWLAGSKYERIVGLHDHTQLHTQMMQGTAERDATKSTDSDSAKKADADKNAVDFEDSDMWSQVACAKAGRPVTMKVEAKDSQVALIDFGKAVPDRVGEVNMRWVRSRVPNTALPYYIAAALLVIATVLSASVFAMTPKPRKKPVKAQGEAGDASPGEVTITEALTGSLQGLRRGLRTSGPGRHSKKSAQEVAQEALVTEEGLRSARELQEQGPSIVDPSLHNLVRQAGGTGVESESDMAAGTIATGDVHSEDGGDIELTSAITDDALQAYFERLSQEESQMVQEVEDQDEEQMHIEPEPSPTQSDSEGGADRRSAEGSGVSRDSGSGQESRDGQEVENSAEPEESQGREDDSLRGGVGAASDEAHGKEGVTRKNDEGNDATEKDADGGRAVQSDAKREVNGERGILDVNATSGGAEVSDNTSDTALQSDAAQAVEETKEANGTDVVDGDDVASRMDDSQENKDIEGTEGAPGQAAVDEEDIDAVVEAVNAVSRGKDGE